MRIVTWNINSLRLRLPLLAEIVATLRPDVVCLQETKVPDEHFPLEGCQELGFPYVAFHGMKGYNGVAILSRYPLTDIRTPGWCDRIDCRHLAAMIQGIDVHCLYVPAGGDIPDSEANPKFAHKLDFLRQVTQWCTESGSADRPMVLAGDFNVAPLESDVWSHKQLLSVVSHTPVEVNALNALQNSIGWVDAVRTFVPAGEKLFTWWSYRSPDWTKNDRGRRLDHIWVTPALAPSLRSTLVARECRTWTQPSDHVPVMGEVEV